MTTDSPVPPASEAPAPNLSALAASLPKSLGWLAAGVMILLWGYAVYRLGTFWYGSRDYAYGWFVPVLCLALFWERWKNRPEPELLAGVTGPVVMFAILALTLLPSCLFLEIIPEWRFAGWGFAGAIIGITFCTLYLLGGRSWIHHFAFPVLFFLVAVPWPTRLEAPLIDKLAHLNAMLSVWVADLLGTPAIRQGVVIQTGAGMVGVDDACSGIRSFQSAVMVALFLGELFRYGFFRRVFFVLSGVALAFGGNVVRTTYLVRVCDLQGKEAVNAAHDPAGFTILGATLVGLLLLALLLRPRHRSKNRSEESAPAEEPETAAELEARTRWSGVENQGTRPTSGELEEPASEAGGQRAGMGFKIALVSLVVWIAAVEFAIEAWFRPAENQAAQAAAKVNWTLQLPSQQQEYREPPMGDSLHVWLKYDEGKQAEWRSARGRPWKVFYLRWRASQFMYRAMEASKEARGHKADGCLKLVGMTLLNSTDKHLQQVNGVTLLANVQRFSDQGRLLHVMSCYWEPDARVIANLPSGSKGTSVALRNVWRALQTRDRNRNEKRVIKIGVWGMETDEEAEAAFTELLKQAIRT